MACSASGAEKEKKIKSGNFTPLIARPANAAPDFDALNTHQNHREFDKFKLGSLMFMLPRYKFSRYLYKSTESLAIIASCAWGSNALFHGVRTQTKSMAHDNKVVFISGRT